MFRLANNDNSTSETQMQAETDCNRTFEVMYAKYSPVIYGMVCKAVNSEIRAASLLQEIFTVAFGKICDGEINVSNCFTCLLALTRKHISEFLKSNQATVKATVSEESKNCMELILVKGYSLKDIENKLNLSRSEARLALRKALNKVKH